jgi:hypothetical protein
MEHGDLPDSGPYESQPKPQTSQDIAMEAIFKMRNIINIITKKKF